MANPPAEYNDAKLPAETPDQHMNAQASDALVRAQRVRSIQFVAQVGMTAVSNLATYEDELASQTPTDARRLRVFGAIATKAIAAEITAMFQR